MPEEVAKFILELQEDLKDLREYEGEYDASKNILDVHLASRYCYEPELRFHLGRPLKKEDIEETEDGKINDSTEKENS